MQNKTTTWKQNISRFLFSQTISLFGSSLVQYAIVWYITLSTSSGKMLTLSTLCGFVPQILISLFAGPFLDRFDRKKIIMAADATIAAATLFLAVSFAAGFSSIWLLFIILAIRSAGTGIQTPAVNAFIPQMVPADKLMKINGINSTISAITMFLSPAISGMVLSLAPLPAVLLIDVVTAIVGVGITFTIPVPNIKRETTIKPSYHKELLEGYAYLNNNSLIRRLLIFQILVLFLISPSAFLTPLMVTRTFGPQIWRLTASEMTYSLGMILGGLLITFWGGFRKKLHTTLLAGAIYGLLMIGLGTAPVFLIYLICNTLIGITSPCYNAPITVTLQETTDPAMQGRVFSFMQLATSCALPFGMLVFGPLADFVPIQSLLLFNGILILIYMSFLSITKHLKIE